MLMSVTMRLREDCLLSAKRNVACKTPREEVLSASDKSVDFFASVKVSFRTSTLEGQLMARLRPCDGH